MSRSVAVFAAFAILTIFSITRANQDAVKTINAAGEVFAVSADSLTVKSKTEEWIFTISKETTVVAKGATHKSLALKADGGEMVLTDFVKTGDTVSVAYHEMYGLKHAATINVTRQAVK